MTYEYIWVVALSTLSIAACNRNPIGVEDTGDADEGSIDMGSIDMGTVSECVHYEQDAGECPDDQKCMPYGMNGEQNGCFDLDAEPDSVGEPCQTGDPYDGLDTCEAGSMCVEASAEGDQICAPFCSYDGETFTCSGPTQSCSVSANSLVRWCFDNCDPFADDCTEGSCIGYLGFGSPHFFWCREPGIASYGDACVSNLDCAAGLLCAPSNWVSGCAGGQCCTALCEVGDDAGCPQVGEGQVCIPMLEELGPVGLAHVGACGF